MAKIVKVANTGYTQSITSLLDALVPVGSIIPFHGGYHANGGKTGFFSKVSAPNSGSWRICNGQSLNDSESPIFNGLTPGGLSKYLPNLTDLVLLGASTPGTAQSNVIGSNNLPQHYHSISHGHNDTFVLYGGSNVASGTHSHTIPALGVAVLNGGTPPQVNALRLFVNFGQAGAPKYVYGYGYVTMDSHGTNPGNSGTWPYLDMGTADNTVTQNVYLSGGVTSSSANSGIPHDSSPPYASYPVSPQAYYPPYMTVTYIMRVK